MKSESLAVGALIVGGLAGVFVFAAAGYAIGGDGHGAAIMLVCAGIASLLGMAMSASSFASGSGQGAIRKTIATVGLLLSGAAAMVALVFAFSFHW
jgi:hypothetical protein